MTGTPTIFATDSPEMTMAMPRPRLLGPSKLPATRVAMPKYAPCGRPAANRAQMTHPTLGSAADASVPTTKAHSSVSKRRLRGQDAADRGNRRCSNPNSRRVGGDHPSRPRVRGCGRIRIQSREQIRGDIRQQPHRDEFGAPNRKTTQHERGESEPHTVRTKNRARAAQY